jgi:hypothetical protein
MNVKVIIQVNGRPLRRAYVEHLVLGVGTGMYITDLEGSVRNIHSDEGIESFTSTADIRIICQNPILRVLDGALLNIGVYQDKSIADGDTVNLNTNAEQDDHFAILNRAQICYEMAFEHLDFFQQLPDPLFPLGKKSSLRETRDQSKRIDLSYPDQSPTPTTFVEPKRLLDNFPLIHLKHRDNENRVFGDNGVAPIVIPAELSHALHFSFLDETKRGTAQDKYLQFIVSSLAAGGDGTHDFTVRTTAEVAFIEALDWYSHGFMEFMRSRQNLGSTLVRVEPVTQEIMDEFVASEWDRVTSPRFPFLDRLNDLLRRQPILRFIPGVLDRFTGRDRGRFERLSVIFSFMRFLRRPNVTGGDVEGAVYSAIFVDFARFVGLDFAASSYFEANAITFGQYITFMNDHHPEHEATLERIRNFWGL